jgi:hypothetical protein
VRKQVFCTAKRKGHAMLLKKADVDELERYVEEHMLCESSEYDTPESGPSVEFFNKRPYLLLPLGFDETRPLINAGHPERYKEFGDKLWFDRAADEARNVNQRYGLDSITFEFDMETIFRSSSSGTWQWFEGLNLGNLEFSGKSKTKHRYSASDLLTKLRAMLALPDQMSRTLWLPKIWSPSLHNDGRRKLGDDVSSVLQQIRAEQKSLIDIHPHILEELVAELLRSKGFSIHLTKKTRDGGRDIIAKADVAFGEPLTIAVEVKHKPVVGTDDLYCALKANENFPALMLVTTGHFSAGVLAEKDKDQNRLRLHLRDGVALSQWIAAYSQ